MAGASRQRQILVAQTEAWRRGDGTAVGPTWWDRYGCLRRVGVQLEGVVQGQHADSPVRRLRVHGRIALRAAVEPRAFRIHGRILLVERGAAVRIAGAWHRRVDHTDATADLHAVGDVQPQHVSINSADGDSVGEGDTLALGNRGSFDAQQLLP